MDPGSSSAGTSESETIRSNILGFSKILKAEAAKGPLTVVLEDAYRDERSMHRFGSRHCVFIDTDWKGTWRTNAVSAGGPKIDAPPKAGVAADVTDIRIWDLLGKEAPSSVAHIYDDYGSIAGLAPKKQVTLLEKMSVVLGGGGTIVTKYPFKYYTETDLAQLRTTFDVYTSDDLLRCAPFGIVEHYDDLFGMSESYLSYILLHPEILERPKYKQDDILPHLKAGLDLLTMLDELPMYAKIYYKRHVRLHCVGSETTKVLYKLLPYLATKWNEMAAAKQHFTRVRPVELVQDELGEFVGLSREEAEKLTDDERWNKIMAGEIVFLSEEDILKKKISEMTEEPEKEIASLDLNILELDQLFKGAYEDGERDEELKQLMQLIEQKKTLGWKPREETPVPYFAIFVKKPSAT
jgi:hypothetical protein